MATLKKVAHVMRRFAPDKWGGAESVVYNLSRELSLQGIESPVFCTDMFAEPGIQNLGGVSVKRYRYLFPWLGLSAEAREKLRLKGGSPLSLPLFFGLLREKNVSIIHAHVQHRLGGMARTAAKWKGVPFVVSLHGGCFAVPADQTRRMMEPFRGKLEWGKVFGFLLGARRVLNDADAILCIGKNEYEEVRRRYPFKNVFLMPNGVDVERFAQGDGEAFRRAYGFTSAEQIILCVARIDYQKNQLGLVRAFTAFARNHPAHRLVLIGPVTVEEYHRQVAAEIERSGMGDRVSVIEGLPPGDPFLAGACKAADMFVLPSLHEPFGIVVLEAWAAGIPVVASRVGGVPGFATDRENILFAEPGNDEELVERMCELADDAVLAEKLAENAYKEVSAHYDWSKVAAQIRAIYEQLAGE